MVYASRLIRRVSAFSTILGVIEGQNVRKMFLSRLDKGRTSTKTQTPRLFLLNTPWACCTLDRCCARRPSLQTAGKRLWFLVFFSDAVCCPLGRSTGTRVPCHSVYRAKNATVGMNFMLTAPAPSCFGGVRLDETVGRSFLEMRTRMRIAVWPLATTTET